jgi:2-oxoglutarate ferredoxin oxidoreductase subunit gamma
MLGFLSAISQLVQVDSLRQAVLSSVPTRTKEINSKAFERGREYGEAIQKSRAKLDQNPETREGTP